MMLVYANQIDGDSQYRFRDAAGLIRANRTPIVDKAAFDMIQDIPTLAQRCLEMKMVVEMEPPL